MVDVQSNRPRGFVAQAKAQPGKTATLCVLAAMMALIWGRALIGGEDKAKTKPKASSAAVASNSAASGSHSATPASPSGTPATSTATAKAPASPQGKIADYGTAVARLEVWRRPLGIEKAEALTEEYLASRREEAEQQRLERWERTQAAKEAGERALASGEGGVIALPDAVDPLEAAIEPGTEPNEALPTVPSISSAPLLVDEDLEVDLTLSGTLLLGDTRFALFGDRRIQEGEQFGRYFLKAVRPREVDLIVDGKLTVVRIAPPDLGSDS